MKGGVHMIYLGLDLFIW